MISTGLFHFLSAAVFTGMTFWIIVLLREMSAAKKLAQCFIQEKRILSRDVVVSFEKTLDLIGKKPELSVEGKTLHKILPVFPAALSALKGLPQLKFVFSDAKISYSGPFSANGAEAKAVQEALQKFFCDKMNINFIGEK